MKYTCLVILLLAIVYGSFSQSNSDGKSLAQWTGSWKLVDVVNINPDGATVRPYGNDPVGILMLDDKGSYSIQILKPQRPKVASGDKNKCTPEEYAALVQGSNSHFGKVIFDTVAQTVVFKIERAFFPNWEGTEQKRFYTVKDDVFSYKVTQTTQGGASVVAEVSWRKIQ
jgi:hypothetical protein